MVDATFPRLWSDAELEEDRNLATQRFIVERREEGPSEFYRTTESVEPLVLTALKETANLTDISGASLLRDPQLWQTLRYFCAPPISEEDLWTLVGSKFKTIRSAHADQTAEALASVVDSRRFPWVQQTRQPTPEELSAAVMATTILMSHEKLKTARRGTASKKQEEHVSEQLQDAGLGLDETRSAILRLDELERGHFSRERKVDGAKCDIPVRLWDGRLLALECKVSNGPKNSWKRLHREVGGKSERWRQEFGSQVVTGAILAGTYDLKCLVSAQNEQKVFIFWQHGLQPLIDFVMRK